jgi:hypothetical protein
LEELLSLGDDVDLGPVEEIDIATFKAIMDGSFNRLRRRQKLRDLANALGMDEATVRSVLDPLGRAAVERLKPKPPTPPAQEDTAGALTSRELTLLKQEASESYEPSLTRLLAAYEAQAREIEGLRAALVKYGRHAYDCTLQFVGEPCDCGLDAARQEPRQSELEILVNERDQARRVAVYRSNELSRKLEELRKIVIEEFHCADPEARTFADTLRAALDLPPLGDPL